jgi:phospholipid/cholesterol/gamma-HCH transport system substrate-binding protein
VKLNKEVKVGLLAVVALTIFYLGFNFLQERKVFSSNNGYCTIYDSCQGLSESSPVLLNGVPVGRVRNLTILPDREYKVLVTFETQKDIKLTDATQTRLISPAVLGSKAIALIIKAGNPLKNYDTVPGKMEPSLGDTVIEGMLPILQDVQHISLLTNQFVANLVENTDRVNSIFYNLESTTRQLKEAIDKHQHEFHVLSQDLSEVAGALADRKDGVRPLLTKLNHLMEGVPDRGAEEIITRLNLVLGSIGKIVERAELGGNGLGRLLYDDQFYNNLNQTLGNLDKLVVDLKNNPARYFSFSVFGKTQSREQAKEE